MNKVFIDGSQGTTGLRIFDRLSAREDIELIKLPENLRKDLKARTDAINSSDITFLCLPDAAAIEIAEKANKLLDKAALDLIELMPAWNPARDAEGNPIRSIFTLPVKFSIME